MTTNVDVFDGMSLASSYADMVRLVMSFGSEVSPRGKPNLEVRPVILSTWPNRNNLAVQDKNVSYRFAMAELMAVVCGWYDVGWLKRFNPRIEQFSDDSSTFHGSYGRRLKWQLPEALDLFSQDHLTRQVVLNIWNSELDLATVSKDLPCNTQVLLKLRDSMASGEPPLRHLHMTVVRRSSDLIWGVPYDHVVFGGLLIALSECLKVIPGQLVEVIDSLHIYKPEAGFYPAERVTAAMEVSSGPKPWSLPLPVTQGDNPVERLEGLRNELETVRMQVEAGVSFNPGQPHPLAVFMGVK